MKKAITIENIIGSIEYITIIDGKESKPSYGRAAIFQVWQNQDLS